MLASLRDITTDFGWVNAKASHGVMLCKMERGSLTWFDSEHIDRLRRAHAQRHSAPNKKIGGEGLTVIGSLGTAGSFSWVCALCTHQKDHEVGGEGSQTLMLLRLISGQVS